MIVHKRNILVKFLFCLILTLQPCIAQEISKDTINNIEYENIVIPRFDVHIGAGWISGARIGFRFQHIEHFSFETSFGIPVTQFLGGEREERYSLGINWHKTIPKGLMLSLICANLVRPDRAYPNIPNNKFLSYLRVSLNIGYLSTIGSNFNFFIRGGVLYDIVESQINSYGGNFGGPNLDLGIGWCFDFNN